MEREDIIVGVDGSPNSIAALRWAAEEAERRHATLVAVTAWEPFATYGAGIGAGVATAAVYEAALRSTGEALESWLAEAIPDGDTRANVKREVLCGSPSERLLLATKDASLLVVGARGRGGFVGLFLGSVASHVVRHATVPTAVIPSAAIDLAKAC